MIKLALITYQIKSYVRLSKQQRQNRGNKNNPKQNQKENLRVR